MSVAKFDLGRTVATPGAVESMELEGVSAAVLLHRHQSGDWGSMSIRDGIENDKALDSGARIFSSYPVGTSKVWIITESDRSSTTILLPEEY